MDNRFSGLMIHGQVKNRHIKKNVGEKNKEYVTYTIVTTDGKEYFVKEWEPDKDNCLNKGDLVDINVYVKTYISNGVAKYGYYIGKENSDFLGDEF